MMKRQTKYLQPFFSNDEGFYLRWVNGKKELYVEFTDKKPEFTKVWGIRIEDEMEVGLVEIVGFEALWEWLMEEK